MARRSLTISFLVCGAHPTYSEPALNAVEGVSSMKHPASNEVSYAASRNGGLREVFEVAACPKDTIEEDN